MIIDKINFNITGIIYKTTNLYNGKIYVGKDCSNDPNYFGSGLWIGRAIKKYGIQNFKKETLEVCNLSIINKKEIYWIAKLDARNPNIGYNIAMGGGCVMKGRKHTIESRQLISNSNKGREVSKETRAKIGDANRGYKHSEEVKARMSKSHKGKKRIFSEEHKQNMSKSRKKLYQSDQSEILRKIASETCRKNLSKKEVREKISNTRAIKNYPSPMLGKCHSEKAKRKMKEHSARKGKPSTIKGKKFNKITKKYE